MEQRRNAGAGQTGDTRENPLTSGIVRHDSHVRRSGSDPAWNRTHMTMKDWCKTLRPIQLYIIMVLTVAFLVAEMVVSHTTHALTLLVDAYHMMCNILSLMGCVVNIKVSSKEALKGGGWWLGQKWGTRLAQHLCPAGGRSFLPSVRPDGKTSITVSPRCLRNGNDPYSSFVLPRPGGRGDIVARLLASQIGERAHIFVEGKVVFVCLEQRSAHSSAPCQLENRDAQVAACPSADGPCTSTSPCPV
ncbi:hypothetical protein PR048_032078, partial [Dryococelus australis]